MFDQTHHVHWWTTTDLQLSQSAADRYQTLQALTARRRNTPRAARLRLPRLATVLTGRAVAARLTPARTQQQTARAGVE
jgi:hypothetical protein